jgi:hypothetical protein
MNNYVIAKRFPRRYNSWHPVENAPSLGEINSLLLRCLTLAKVAGHNGLEENLRTTIAQLTALEEKA